MDLSIYKDPAQDSFNSNITPKIDEYSIEIMQFIPRFINAVHLENASEIIELANNSTYLLDIKQDNSLPPICFETPTIEAFQTVFISPYDKSFLLFTLKIFRNIYLNKFISNMDLFPPSVLLSLLECINHTDPDVIKIIIEIIRGILNNSTDVWPHFVQAIPENILFETLKNVDNESYLSLLCDYIFYCSSHKQFQEVNLLQTYHIIYGIFSTFCKKYIKYSQNQEENEVDYQFYRQLALQLLQAFQNITLTDKLINARTIQSNEIPIVHKIIKNFILFRFICINDEAIYYENIRVLSSLCTITTIQAIQQNGNYSLRRKNHIYFDIYNSKINLFSHFINEFNKSLEFPPDSPYFDIPAAICPIIIRFSKQLLESKDKTGIRVMPTLFSESFIPKLKWLFENQNNQNKHKIIGFFYFLLEGTLPLIIHLLNSDIISLMSSLLNSDEPVLIKKCLKFFDKLTEIVEIQRIQYPVAEEVQQYELIELIDQFLYGAHSIDYPQSLLELAEKTKSHIISRLFSDNPHD